MIFDIDQDQPYPQISLRASNYAPKRDFLSSDTFHGSRLIVEANKIMLHRHRSKLGRAITLSPFSSHRPSSTASSALRAQISYTDALLSQTHPLDPGSDASSDDSNTINSSTLHHVNRSLSLDNIPLVPITGIALWVQPSRLYSTKSRTSPSVNAASLYSPISFVLPDTLSGQ